MKMTIAALALVATASTSGAATAAGAAALSPCLDQAEARAVTLAALPEVLHQAGLVCGAHLPADALLRQDGALAARYRAGADRAWPAARAALAKLADPTTAPLLQSDFARPLLAALVVPQLVGRIDPADCPALDRMVTLLAPLPPANVAGVVVTALGWLKDRRNRGKAADVPDLPLCPTGKRR